ncbi:DEAD/DEAH box helicase [Massilia glaciei]|uniref:Helicase n=1 Tax=Massilia glaciei TaxID=1524097 RepID=A0A2U2HNV3_9BURK|nr:DEAD/DEAH box helicase [Massilia glaciei]PWF49095.1 helicase [Massilia glaciei]
MNFTLDDILDNFDNGTYRRGRDYAQHGMVRALARKDARITSKVNGSGGSAYTQSIAVLMRPDGVVFNGDCSCPMDYNCKHVVAALLVWLEKAPAGPVARRDDAQLAPALTMWLRQVQVALEDSKLQPVPKSTGSHRLLCVLLRDLATGRVEICLCKARVAAGGRIVSATVYNDSYALVYSAPAFVGPPEQFVVRLFTAMNGSSFGGAVTEVRHKAGALLLRAALELDCLGMADSKADIRTGQIRLLKPGPARQGRLGWAGSPAQPDALRLCWRLDDDSSADCVLATEPPMYIQNGLLGELALDAFEAAVPIQKLQALVTSSPQLPARDVAAFSFQMAQHGLGSVVPLPPPVEQRTRGDIKPRPILLLGSIERSAGDGGGTVWDDYALVAFDYDGERVANDPSRQLGRWSARGFENILRDEALESAARAQLAALGFRAPSAAAAARAPQGIVQLPHANDWLRFARDDLPLLAARGWDVQQEPSFRFDVSEVDDWYADVEQGGDNGSPWFELELGIVVNGARHPLLPVLLQLIRGAPREFDRAVLDAHADTDQLIAHLPGGVNVALPWGRIKPILHTLGELYFNEKIGDTLRLPELDAARLAELEAGAQLRWMGGERLREIGHKLRSFGGVQAVAAPAGLQASLRPYQSEGLSWMQFLREFGLAGILADDMGLGKTIQTLAHILTEKEAGRLTAPALVVAPTSLMGNWQAEAARFAPGLRVLLLHGADRAARFGQIGQSDLVLTTFALLPRDEEQLRAQQFHLLILDESQYIKNSRSKAAQTAVLLNARHRLCLTGTPLQNHLGELWAQFHFLLPGLLGDEKAFNADFRKPIEKLGDAARNAFLVRRIKPFLLRRTKDAVATELPAKTEMVREVELAGAQRDLYETVRVAMDKKVRDAIASKGVARSQIVILDALLKLRQVCCDPRLVKLAGEGARGAPSAKLAELMEMVAALLDEGRKIIVFSQFTSMLALIEAELRERAISYALLTGETKDRSGQVDAFQRGAVPVFLISLKAGGVGLNLTAANTVIHYDPWWNPAVENQATDRAWRIGQDKPVFVYKLIAKGTLEEKIQELQRKKAELADAVLAGGTAQDLALTQADLQAILAPL